MKIFSNRLRELRIASGMTQRQVAELLQIKQQSYARYEYGTGEPNLQTVTEIAKIFDVSCDYLLGLTDY
ncbi:MAG: helix-turn-helix transcriptional regulator [Clostridia bacterium]|nr:helix-turn-helix transcriptional regulator [Clostridia bacterium]MDE7215004.1 helix-turn-helix transcriptional regulator [Clostridia bacterium]